MSAALPQPKLSPERIHEQYLVEKELALRLRSANAADRPALYSAIYDELYRRVPGHTQRTIRPAASVQRKLARQLRVLRGHLRPDTVFLEVGAGDCALSLAAANHVRQVYAVEVSDELVRGIRKPSNFTLLSSDGFHFGLPDNSVDVAYSHQLIEHMHPDDALAQLREIHRVLKPGGAYVCVTPNRLSGPHDISRFFDRVASGLHLKEYSLTELAQLFRKSGFIRIRAIRRAGSTLLIPVAPLSLIEYVLEWLPWRVRKPLAKSWLISRILDGTIVGRKSLR